jgi:hypothetical protein
MKKNKKMTCANKSVAKEEAGRCKSLSFRFGMKTCNVFKYVCVATIIVASCFIIGCQKEEDTYPKEDEIVNSVELEEYIIAASDFKQSLAVFEKELCKVDFSKLEVTYDTDGREIMRLPVSVSFIMIEEKIRIFNEAKQALLEKYPQFTSFALYMREKYFQRCIQNSLNVSDRLLELGINFSLPLLKGVTIETWSGTGLASFLSSWVNNANYVEVYIIRHENSTNSIYIDDRNTANTCYLSYTKKDGKYYIDGNNSPIAYIAHTHRNSKNPSTADIAAKAQMPGIPHYIYYNGTYYQY